MILRQDGQVSALCGGLPDEGLGAGEVVLDGDIL